MENKVYYVDFKSRKLVDLKTDTSENNSVYDFSNFNPIIKGSNFEAFSDKDRFEYSEHVIAYTHETTFEDLAHWVNNGMVDKKKLAEKLGIDYRVLSFHQ